MALALSDGLKRSDAVALVVDYEDPKSGFALPTLQARVGRRVSLHRLRSVSCNYYAARLEKNSRHGLYRISRKSNADADETCSGFDLVGTVRQ